MKKALLILAVVFMTISYSQELKQVPSINVSGEGKVKVAPDQASISISIETIATPIFPLNALPAVSYGS